MPLVLLSPAALFHVLYGVLSGDCLHHMTERIVEGVFRGTLLYLVSLLSRWVKKILGVVQGYLVSRGRTEIPAPLQH